MSLPKLLTNRNPTREEKEEALSQNKFYKLHTLNGQMFYELADKIVNKDCGCTKRK